jgi:UTP--glucose-1-phosphate uridylyltransferase
VCRATLPLPVVIPAAGLGARFLPLSRVVPKELLPLGSLPLIHHALLEAERAGLSPVTIVTSPSKGAIRAYFEDDALLEPTFAVPGGTAAVAAAREPSRLAHRLRLRFVESETRGPGEAVLTACEATGSETVAVLFPDDVIPGATPWASMCALWRATGRPVMSVRRFAAAESERFGVAQCERQDTHLRVRRLVEKPAPGTVASPLRVYGRYIITPPVLRALARRRCGRSGELQLTDGYADCLEEPCGVLAYEYSGEAFDCGTPAEYAASVSEYGRWS